MMFAEVRRRSYHSVERNSRLSRSGGGARVARAAKPKRVKAPDGSFVVRGRAANGEGSLYQEADGVWRATYWVAGETRPRRVRGRTREEAFRRRLEAVEKVARSRSESPGHAALKATSTVSDMALWWLETVARHRVRPSSFGKYEDRVARIVPSLGEVCVDELRPEQVARWQSGLLGSLSPKTVADTRATLRSIMEEARNLGVVASNVVDRVKPPTVRRRSRRALTAKEARALVSAAVDDRLGAAVALLFIQGWRVSEVLGLAWADVDLDEGLATVRRACVYADGHGMMLGPPKTAGAEGQHLLAPIVVELLRRRKDDQVAEIAAAGDAWKRQSFEGWDIELIFTTPAGGLVLRQAVTKAVATAALAAGLDPTGLGTHGGRSTAITALYGEEGVDLADVARHVGHSNPAMTATFARPRSTSPGDGRGGGAPPRSDCRSHSEPNDKRSR
jgi:integrase